MSETLATSTLVERLKTWLGRGSKYTEYAFMSLGLVEQVVAKLEANERDLAECYRLSGADSDGNEDWRLAPYAVAAVRDLRKDYDDSCVQIEGEQMRAGEAADTLEAQEREIASLVGHVDYYCGDGWTDPGTHEARISHLTAAVNHLGGMKLDYVKLANRITELEATLVTRTQERDEALAYRDEVVNRADLAEAYMAGMRAACGQPIDPLPEPYKKGRLNYEYQEGLLLAHELLDVFARRTDRAQERAESAEAKVAALTADLAQAREALAVLVAMYGPSTDYDFKAKAVWEQAEVALSPSQEPR